MTRRRLAAAALVGALVLGACAPASSEQPSASVTATQPPKDAPSADPLITALPAALSSQDLSAIATDVPATTVAADIKTIMSGMDGLLPTVTVGNAIYDGETATVPLSYTWPGIGTWAYDTSAHLVLVNNAWQLQWRPDLLHPSLTSHTRLRHQRTQPKRVAINDSTGLALVETRPQYQVGLDKSKVEPAAQAQAAADLATILGIDAAAYQKKVAAAGERQFVVATTLDSSAIMPTITSVPGATTKETSAVVGPSNGWAASILGTVGTPTTEMLEASEGRLEATDTVGLSGLQNKYDAQLGGTPEIRIDLVPRTRGETNDDGSEVTEENLFLQDASVGSPIAVSLDRDLQTKAETVLSSQTGVASLVVIRPTDGAVLVAANSPAAGTFPQATYGKYAPGSTFKVVSSLAMLRTGLTPTSTVNCPSHLNVSGHDFTNYSDYPSSALGKITLTKALANSCNTAFAGGAATVTPEQLTAAAGSLGVGTDYESGFTSNFGTVAPNNSAIDRAASMIGQGQITMAPLGMATVAASVASGKTTIPWIVEGHQATSTAAALTATEATQLQTMMKAVVTEGSGRVLSGLFTGAKTGTAEYGTAPNYKTHAWMIAWNDKYAVAAFVETGESGSKTAAPLIKALFS